MSARMTSQSWKHIPDLVAMGTVITLPICKHKPVNTDTEDVAINTHQNMWNDTVNIQRSGMISLSISHQKSYLSVRLEKENKL